VGGYALSFAWSAGGAQLVATVPPADPGNEPYGDVGIVGSDGSGRRALAHGMAGSFSPDGRRVAFSAEPSRQLTTMGVDGGSPTALRDGEADPWLCATWSPDGRLIAAVHEHQDSGDHNTYRTLAVVRADSGQLVGERRGNQGIGCPSWSPDSGRLVFSDFVTDASNGSQPSDAWVMDTDGSHATDLGFDCSTELDPTWSPDGALLALVRMTNELGPSLPVQPNECSDTPDVDGLWVVHPDGSGLRKVTGLVEPASPSWSPDGQRLVVTAERGGSRAVVIVGMAGGTRTLARGVDSQGRDQPVIVRWSPASSTSSTGGTNGAAAPLPAGGRRPSASSASRPGVSHGDTGPSAAEAATPAPELAGDDVVSPIRPARPRVGLAIEAAAHRRSPLWPALAGLLLAAVIAAEAVFLSRRQSGLRA
jgi:dipeptidyl aminopeptidase/acylaminoacyl peptidase